MPGAHEYRYVGPAEIARAVQDMPSGRVVSEATDLARWLSEQSSEADAAGLVWATCVVDLRGRLRISHRSTEHVACAGGEAVQAAGEVAVDAETQELGEITNLSTGYCPEASCYPVVRRAFEKAGLPAPRGFTIAFTFRRCVSCGQRDVIKDEAFECDSVRSSSAANVESRVGFGSGSVYPAEPGAGRSSEGPSAMTVTPRQPTRPQARQCGCARSEPPCARNPR